MLRVANRVKESTLTSGSGTIALAGASNGYQSFSSVLSNGDTSYYTIVNVDSWEVGIGTYSSNTLSRDVVLSSSNSNNKLDLNGQSYVFIAYPSEKSVYKDQNDQVVVGSSGVIIGSGNPFITSNVLYNSGGILYFNGLPVNSSVSITGVSGIGVSQSGNSYTISATGSFGLTSSQVQQLLNSGVSINVVSGTGNFNVLSVTGTPVSLSGHTHLSSSIINFNTSVSGLLIPYALLNSGNFTTLFVTNIPVSLSGHLHTSSNITDFNSSVSGLLPSVSGSGYARVLLSNNVYTVSVTGLQPSGNYSISGHQHTSSDIINFNSSVSGLLAPYALLNSGNFTTLLVTNIPVSLSGHLHTSSQITDFNSTVSGLLPFTGILGSGYVTLNSSNRILTIGVSGLQPSGNYSISGHTHTASNITDFNSTTSGLLTPYALLNSGSFTNLYVAGTVVSLSGHTHTSNQITDFNSTVSGILSSGVNIKLLNGSGTLQSLTIADTGTISTLQINKFYHNNLSIASGFADSDMLIAITNPTGTPITQMLQGSVLRSSLLNQAATLRFRQGLESERLLITPATGEPIWVTDAKKFYIGDGSTVGGIFMSPTSVSGSTYIISSTVSGITTISATGLQPTSSLPVKNILAGTNIGVNSVSGIFTISSSGGGASSGMYSPLTTGTQLTAILPTVTSGNSNDSLYSTIINGNDNLITVTEYGSINNGQGNTLNTSSYCSILNGSANNIPSNASNSLIGVGNNGLLDGVNVHSTILNGASCQIIGSAYYNSILNGNSNVINSTTEYCTIVNGNTNIINSSCLHSTIFGGLSNTVSAPYSVILGGINTNTSNQGELIFGGSVPFGQKSTFVLNNTTTDAVTQTTLALDNDTFPSLIIPARTTWNFNIQLSAYNLNDETAAGSNFRGIIRRNATDNTVLLGNTIIEKWSEGIMSGVLSSVVANNSNETLDINVNGLFGKQIKWVATVELSQVKI